MRAWVRVFWFCCSDVIYIGYVFFALCMCCLEPDKQIRPPLISPTVKYFFVARLSDLHCPMQCSDASSEGNPWRLYHFVRLIEWYPLVSPLEVC